MLYVGNSNYAHAQEGCYTCGRGDQLVSTEVSIDGEGILVLCKGCITDLARAGDIAVEPGEAIRELERQRDAAVVASEAFADQLAETESRLERLQNEWVDAVEIAQASRA